MMDAQDLLLHGNESRELKHTPKVLQMCLQCLEKRAESADPDTNRFFSMADLFLEAVHEHSAQLKKVANLSPFKQL